MGPTLIEIRADTTPLMDGLRKAEAMHRDRWNKLIRRAMQAYAKLPLHRRVKMKRRWLAWAERTTNSTCFWMQW